MARDEQLEVRKPLGMYTACLCLVRVVGAVALLAVSASGAGRPFEAYMVTVPEAEMYQGTRRSRIRLCRGDVVTARPDELHRDWLDVVVGRIQAQANGNQFSRLVDLRTAYAVKVVDLQSRMEELADEIDLAQAKIEQLHAAEYAIRFDSTVRYRFREVVPLQVAVDPPRRNRDPAPRIPLSFAYRYEDKISPSRARNQANSWRGDRQQLERQVDVYRSERRQMASQQAAALAMQRFVEWRFAAYRLGSGVLQGEPYVTVRDRVQLYDGDRLAAEIDADVVLPAALNREDDDWLKVRFQGRLFDGRQRDFLNRLGIESTMGDRVAWLTESINVAQDRARELAGRRERLEAVTVSADYSSRLEYLQVTSNPFPSGYPGSRHYAASLCPPGALEFVSRDRAMRFIGDCEDELEDIERQIMYNRRQMRDWRRELAGLRPRLENLRARMNSAE